MWLVSLSSGVCDYMQQSVSRTLFCLPSDNEGYVLKDDKCRGCEESERSYLNTCPSCGIVYCDKCKEYIKTGEHASDMVEHLLLNCCHRAGKLHARPCCKQNLEKTGLFIFQSHDTFINVSTKVLSPLHVYNPIRRLC